MRAWCVTSCMGKGGEQGGPLMPLLFSLGIHDAPQASQQGLGSEHLLAFLNDAYVVTLLPRVAHKSSLTHHHHTHTSPEGTLLLGTVG